MKSHLSFLDRLVGAEAMSDNKTVAARSCRNVGRP
jgi:hypothetical protein